MVEEFVNCLFSKGLLGTTIDLRCPYGLVK